MYFKTKPIIIEAFRFNVDQEPDWFKGRVKSHQIFPLGDRCTIQTMNGPAVAFIGDYIIKGIKDEVYPCKPNIFEEKYTEFVPITEHDYFVED